MEDPSLGRALARAAMLRCPRCGSRHIFRWWFSMVPDCPRCGLHFEREEGYWLGSMTISIGVTMALFMVVLVGGMALFWPDVPWNGLWAATIGLMVMTPVVIHPFTRTLWVAVERHVRAMSDGAY